MNLYLPLARSAAVLAGLPAELRQGDVEEMRRTGIAALDRLIQAAPEADRPALRERHDVVLLRAALESASAA